MNFKGMKDKFYRLMQMDPEKGVPDREILEEYGMSEEAKRTWEKTL